MEIAWPSLTPPDPPAGTLLGKSRTSHLAVFPQRSVALTVIFTSLEPAGTVHDQCCAQPSSAMKSTCLMPELSEALERVISHAVALLVISSSGTMTGGSSSPSRSVRMHLSKKPAIDSSSTSSAISLFAHADS